MGVKDGHTTHGESSFGKKLWCVLIVVFLGGIGWQMWKLNAYNNAVREAKEAGFVWYGEDTISLKPQDRNNALIDETWSVNDRVLLMGEVRDLGRYREMLHRLRPTALRAWGCENVDGLMGLTSLQWLDLRYCHALQNVDVLKSLTGLRTLDLSDCPVLQNLAGLKGLIRLQTLDLRGCTALQNVDALKGLTNLRTLSLHKCDKIPAAALRELRAALPNTDIIFPDLTWSPPQ